MIKKMSYVPYKEVGVHDFNFDFFEPADAFKVMVDLDV